MQWESAGTPPTTASAATAAEAGIAVADAGPDAGTAGKPLPTRQQEQQQTGGAGGGGGRRCCGRPAWCSVSGPLPPVEVLGIDDHRRGRPMHHRDPATGRWDVDRWQTVFVDAGGGHGLLGQVKGRTAKDMTAWLAARDRAWREGIRYVTIDMFTV
jgi:hypothetical protein